VTPSSHFPTGVALSRERRAALLQWAKTSNAWILEDDYEADFVFEGEAPPSLAAEYGTDRVLYLSALNHVLFPAAQLAYLVVPEALVDRFNAVRVAIDGAVNLPLQMVTHDFIEGGYLAAHIRRCIRVYGERRNALRRAIEARLGNVFRLARQPIGLHVMAWLRELDDARLEQAAARGGVVIHSLRDGGEHAPATPPGVYMGFAAYAPQVIEQAIKKLERIVIALGGQHTSGA
jgi:GntR family transcriptional regulator/MocR family aminotransferase